MIDPKSIRNQRPATKAQLRAEIAELRSVGSQMSNLCFNLSQANWQLEPHDRVLMGELYRKWDQIKRMEKP